MIGPGGERLGRMRLEPRGDARARESVGFERSHSFTGAFAMMKSWLVGLAAVSMSAATTMTMTAGTAGVAGGEAAVEAALAAGAAVAAVRSERARIA